MRMCLPLVTVVLTVSASLGCATAKPQQDAEWVSLGLGGEGGIWRGRAFGVD